MTDRRNGSRFIFVGGAPRSGTTLVQNILDSHSDICGGPEFMCLPDIVALRTKLHHLIRRRKVDSFCSYDEVDRLLSSLTESLLLPLAERQGSGWLSEKTPANVLVFPQLVELFPEARLIHVVRDPRATIASLLSVGKRGDTRGRGLPSWTHDVTAAIRLVKSHLELGFEASERYPDSILTVVYERLVFEPAQETKRICDFLQVDWSSQLIHPGSINHPGEMAITDDIWYTQQEYARDPEPREAVKWQTQLTLLQQMRIGTAFRDVDGLAQLGYDFSLSDRSIFGRLFVLVFLAVYKFRNDTWLGKRFTPIFSGIRTQAERLGL